MDEKKLLQEAVENGMIDTAILQKLIYMAERKKYLEGVHIWQGTNGQWFCKLSQDGQKKLIKRKTKNSLEDAIIKIKKEEENRPTVRQVYLQWIEKKTEYGEICKSTKDRYQKDYNRFIKDSCIEGKIFGDITADEWEDFIKTTIAKYQLTSKSYAGLRLLIRGMMIFAKGKYSDISAESFFGDMSFSKNTFKKNVLYKEKQVYMEEEAKILAEYLQRSKQIHALGILLVFQTGIRVGELSSLKAGDIVNDESGTFLHIQRTESKIQKPDGGQQYIVTEYPKSSAGDRYVFCNQEAEKLLSGILKKGNDNYLFCNKSGRMNGGMFDRFLRRSCDKCGILRKSMHKIRKTYGTMLIDGGVDEAVIIEQMGHSDIHCTKQYYYFSNKKREKKASQLSAVKITW